MKKESKIIYVDFMDQYQKDIIKERELDKKMMFERYFDKYIQRMEMQLEERAVE